MSARFWAGVPLAVFGMGIAVGFAARKRNVPPDQVHRWLLKEATRKALGVYDAALDLAPNAEPVRLTDALADEPSGRVPT